MQSKDKQGRDPLEQTADSRHRYLEMLLDESPISMWVYDPDSLAFLRVNKAAIENYGYSSREFSQMTLRDIRPSEDVDLLDDYLAKPRSKERSIGYWRHQRKDGSIIHVELIAHSVRFDGRWARLVMALDVTERKTAEDALRESEHRLELFFAQSLDGFFFMMLDKPVRWDDSVDKDAVLDYVFSHQRITKVNEAMAEQYGGEASDFLGLTPKDFYSHDLAYGKNVWREFFDAGRLHIETDERKMDGSQIWVEGDYICLYDEEGRITGHFGIQRNITERRRALDALQQYSKQKEILQAIDHAILNAQSPEEIAQAAMTRINELIPCRRASVAVFNEESGIARLIAIYANHDTALGPGAELPMAAFGPKNELINGKPLVAANIDTSRPEDSIVHSEGVTAYVTLPLIAEGDLIGVMNIGVNDAEKLADEQVEIARTIAASLSIAIHQSRLREAVEQHAEELEKRVAERTAEIESFSYSVSHDLRTPLLTIDGFSQILLEDHGESLDEDGKRLLNIISENTKKMGKLIDDLLRFSRLGHRELILAEVNLDQVVEAAWQDIQLSLIDRDIQLGKDALGKAYGDFDMLKIVFVNLLANAVKFTRYANVARIEIGVQEIDNVPTYYIKDNGVGFDMAYAGKLFGVFQRLHAGDDFDGTGVGLAIVSRIVQRHNGRVWAEGEQNKGATIYFTLSQSGV